MYNNESIYNNLMTVLRKEKEGKTISEEQFNQLLKLGSEEEFNLEYEKYEISQRETDSIRSLKTEEEIELDYLGEFDLTDLTYDYIHPSYLNFVYNNKYVNFDFVTDWEWSERISSDLMYPSYYYPIAKIKEDVLKSFPVKREYSATNLVTNSGYTGTTDWVDSNSDGVADNWVSLNISSTGILTNQFQFDRAQYFELDNLHSFYTSTNVVDKNSWYYVEFDYYFSSGAEALFVLAITDGSNTILDITPTYDQKIKFKSIFFYPDYGSASRPFEIDFALVAPNANRLFIIDNVFLADLGEAPKLNFGYLRKPSDPYFDYYYDANDRVVYLNVGDSHTLTANETYIDKDDGTVRTSGYTITAQENKTVELWLPENERPRVFYNILQKLGISLTKQDALQYGIAKEQS